MGRLHSAARSCLAVLQCLGGKAGAALVYSAYFITLPGPGDGEWVLNTWYRLLIVATVVSGAHAAAWFTSIRTAAHAGPKGQGGWAGKARVVIHLARCTLEVSLFFLLEQNISTARDSKMYIPSELVYFLPVTCALFVLPASLGCTHAPRVVLHCVWGASTVAVWAYLSVFTMQDKDSLQPHSYPSHPVSTTILLCLLALVFCYPTGAGASIPQAAAHQARIRQYLASCGACIALLVIAVFLLLVRRGNQQAAPERMRDFYSIRTVTNTDRILSSVGTVWPTQWDPELQPAAANGALRFAMLFVPMHLRLHTLLASCYWFARVTSELDALAQEALNATAGSSVHLKEMHILLAASTVALGFFSVSRGRDHNTFHAVDSDGNTVWHSMRLLWGLCGILGTAMSCGLLHWASTFFWRRRRGRRNA